jgi:hypothetical protein
MGPTLRPFSYHRDPWWDATGRVSRRRRRRRLLAWMSLIVLGGALGLVAGEARAAGAALPVSHSTGSSSSVMRSVDRSTR